MNIIFAILLGCGLGLIICIIAYILHTALGEYIDNIIYRKR